MSKLDKRLLCQADIIQATLTLLKQKRFLDLKMSEVARPAEYSMGTLYSHFSSR
ncbi:MAG: TetR/AcrR family transcriptional regulator [Endozoicomonas sp.]